MMSTVPLINVLKESLKQCPSPENTAYAVLCVVIMTVGDTPFTSILL